MSRHFVSTGLVVVLLSAQALWAQVPQQAENPAKSQAFLYEIALKGAIGVAGQRLAQQALAVVPEFTLETAEPAVVRGVRLGGFGFFFDVQVPDITSSMMVFDMMNRQRARPQPNESPVQPVAGSGEVASGPLARPAMAGAVPFNPDRAYTGYVKDALIDALLDSSGVLTLAPEERLAIAVSGIDQPNSNPLYRSVERKLVLTIKASDLQDLRAGRISRDQVKERITQEPF